MKKLQTYNWNSFLQKNGQENRSGLIDPNRPQSISKSTPQSTSSTEVTSRPANIKTPSHALLWRCANYPIVHATTNPKSIIPPFFGPRPSNQAINQERVLPNVVHYQTPRRKASHMPLPPQSKTRPLSPKTYTSKVKLRGTERTTSSIWY